MPHVSTIPAVGLRMPAMMKMRVVCPQPDGPTSMVSSPAGASRLIPWSTSTSSPPAGNDLVTPLHRTAIDGARIATSGVDHHDPADAREARNDDDNEHGDRSSNRHLPRQFKGTKVDRGARCHLKEAGAKSNAD